MKVASVAFLVVLLLTHCAGDPARLLGLPLSMLRHGSLGPFGYLLFVLLLLIAGLMLSAFVRARMYGPLALFSLASFLLLLVAVTPSTAVFHLLCSFVLLALLYAYFAAALRPAGLVWFWLHLSVPVILAGVTQFHSYGLWQKSLILYFLLAASVHHHLLTHAPPAPTRAAGPRRSWVGRPRQLVFSLDAGRSWARRR
jgi:hypothetical protein